MMTVTLPDIDIPCKALKREGINRPLVDEPLAEFGSDSETKTSRAQGSIVIRIGLSGSYSVQILADQSDEANQLLERLTAARPLLELLQKIFAASNGTEGAR